MAAKINVLNIPHGYQTIISNGVHSIVGDEPTDIKGTFLGLSPSELLIGAIAMCKVATIRYEAHKKGWELKDIKAELTQEVTRGENRSFSTKVIAKIDIQGEISPEQKQELIKRVENCHIERLIAGHWNTEISAVDNLPI